MLTKGTSIGCNQKTQSFDRSVDVQFTVTNIHGLFEKPLEVHTGNLSNDGLLEPDKQPPITVCYYYRIGKCNKGQDCKYRHPPKCIDYCRNGRAGCNKGRKCPLLHPILCRNALKTLQCYDQNCTFAHLKGTVRKIKSGHQNHQQLSNEIPVPMTHSYGPNIGKSKQWHQDAFCNSKPVIMSQPAYELGSMSDFPPLKEQCQQVNGVPKFDVGQQPLTATPQARNEFESRHFLAKLLGNSSQIARSSKSYHQSVTCIENKLIEPIQEKTKTICRNFRLTYSKSVSTKSANTVSFDFTKCIILYTNIDTITNKKHELLAKVVETHAKVIVVVEVKSKNCRYSLSDTRASS